MTQRKPISKRISRGVFTHRAIDMPIDLKSLPRRFTQLNHDRFVRTQKQAIRVLKLAGFRVLPWNESLIYDLATPSISLSPDGLRVFICGEESLDLRMLQLDAVDALKWATVCRRVTCDLAPRLNVDDRNALTLLGQMAFVTGAAMSRWTANRSNTVTGRLRSSDTLTSNRYVQPKKFSDQQLRTALKQAKSNKDAARLLGVTPQTISRRLKNL